MKSISLPHLSSLSFSVLLLSLLSGCVSIAPWYRVSNRRPYPSKRYTAHWCYELPQRKVAATLHKLLKSSKFQFRVAAPSKGLFLLKPASVPQYSRNINYGYELTLSVRTEESRGKLNVSALPKWSLSSGKIPTPDKRQFNLNTLDGIQRYQAAQQSILEKQVAASALMKHWKGCNVLSSTIRTRVLVKVKVMRFPYGPFNTFERRSGKAIASDLTMEMSLLRVLSRKLRRRGPRILYY